MPWCGLRMFAYANRDGYASFGLACRRCSESCMSAHTYRDGCGMYGVVWLGVWRIVYALACVVRGITVVVCRLAARRLAARRLACVCVGMRNATDVCSPGLGLPTI